MEDNTDGGSSHSASLTSVDLSGDQAPVADLTGNVNRLPCCIKEEAPSAVSKVEEAYFRHGATLDPPPEGYSGFILGKRSPDKETCTTATDRWPPNMTFHNVTEGNHDAMPSNDDAFLRAFHWFSTTSSKAFQNVQQTKKIAHTGARNDKWAIKEDIALMSSWCFASEDTNHGKKQRKISFWARVQQLYDTYQVDNSEEIGPRNDNQMKGRWKRLNENANKWIAAYREAYTKKMSGVGVDDVEKEAHSIYEASGSKFYDHIVFNEVMCKHPKWELQIDPETTGFLSVVEVGNEESGSSTKRPKTSKEGDNSMQNTQELVTKEKCMPNRGGSTILHFTCPENTQEMVTKEKCMPNSGGSTILHFTCSDAVAKEKCMPNSSGSRILHPTCIDAVRKENCMPNGGGSTIPRPTSRDAATKEKCKVSGSSSSHNEFVAELHELGISRDREVELMNKRLDLELKKEERKAKKMYHVHLNTLLAKEHLSKEDKDMKRHLWVMLFGK